LAEVNDRVIESRTQEHVENLVFMSWET